MLTTLSWWLVALATVATSVVGEGGFAMSRWAPMLEQPGYHVLSQLKSYEEYIRDESKEVIVVTKELFGFEKLGHLIVHAKNKNSKGFWVNGGRGGLLAVKLRPASNTEPHSADRVVFTYIDEITKEVREVTEGEDDWVKMFDDFMIWVRTLPVAEIERREAARKRVLLSRARARRQVTQQVPHREAVGWDTS